MIFSAEAERQIGDLLEHYSRLSRPEAAVQLRAAIGRAVLQIQAKPDAGLAAPRPYPHLAQSGRAWVKSGRYWFRYTTVTPTAIVAVFFDAADIPGRL